MKRLLLAATVASALAFMSCAHAAGIDFQNIPQHGAPIYLQLPDGTFAPAQGDATGNAKSSPAPYVFTKLGCGQLTSLGTASAFPSVPSGAMLVTLQVEGQSVRYRDDGTNPTASVGVLLPVSGPWPYSSDLVAIKFIQTTASATINYCFYK